VSIWRRGQFYLSSGTATAAFWAFAVFYVGASILTWAIYVRPMQAATAADAASPAGLAYV
jgi:NNP family nitrate/nitrite transporter-like MFS transporter